MDHEAYDSQVIDIVNRKGEEAEQFEETTPGNATTQKRPLMDKNDARVLTRGLKRTALALVTAILFTLAVAGFIAVATAPGYLAVLLFLASLIILGGAFVFLYAQGITHKMFTGNKEESK